LYEAPAATPVSELTAALVSLYNARLRLSRLCAEGAELASYGPSRPPEQQARGGVGTQRCASLCLRRADAAVLHRAWTRGCRGGG
jgi:hypothetical protein